MPHIVGHVDTEDVLPVNLGVELLGFVIVTRESFGGVRDVDATVHGAFHGSKDSCTGGGSGEAGVETSSESSRAFSGVLNHEMVAIDLGLTQVNAVQVKLLKNLEAKTKKTFNTRAEKYQEDRKAYSRNDEVCDR